MATYEAISLVRGKATIFAEAVQLCKAPLWSDTSDLLTDQRLHEDLSMTTNGIHLVVSRSPFCLAHAGPLAGIDFLRSHSHTEIGSLLVRKSRS